MSLGLHILLVVLFGLSGLSFRKPGAAARDILDDDRYSFLVIEVPDDVPAESPAEPTYLVSDRAARAADMSPDEEVPPADPYSEGDIEIPDPRHPGVDAAPAPLEAGSAEPGRRDADRKTEDGPLGGDIPEEVADSFVDRGKGGQNGSPGRPVSFKNLLSAAGRRGGLSFNTYNWDFAPYMLAMKQAIESHLFPPYAFTHMGLVSGTNVVRFTVMPDGLVTNLKILGSDAHFSLDRTSVRAIEASVPFLPLPRDFPEEHLEVTAHFSYVVRGGD